MKNDNLAQIGQIMNALSNSWSLESSSKWSINNPAEGQCLTASQFIEDIEYMDIPSNREEAYSDTNEKQYNYLKQSVLIYLNEYLLLKS